MYDVIKIAYYKQTNKVIWKSILYTVLLLSYMGIVSILTIGTSYSKSAFVESYIFGEKIFYVYENIDLSYEVSVKVPNLPIRSLPIASFSSSPVILKTDQKYIYATGDGIDEKIYDLNKGVSIKPLKIQRKNYE